ncbi:uncharacterized protein [Aegilops tauschii subsp. strangulata]|uniref:uncharacterized protein n=1 Tax=Aegilops tauschii subsp. strangulata TaxID=200361 RepID=UPI001E1CAC67|nr:uncharacterized protein LOC123494762 [Aegilops tauschii subsp. strangulata]
MATDKKGELLLTEIPDHPLTEILLRLPTPQDLARACAACSTFRRIATDASFRRRFRRLHAPPLLGFLDREGFHPAAAPAARALARIADFSFSFLPSYCSWTVQDVRDGRVLLARDPDPQEEDEQPPVFTDLVVCDPLHRRFIVLPPVPRDLAASVDDPADPVFCGCFCEPSLIPPPQRGGGSGGSGRDSLQSDLVRAFQHQGIHPRILFEHQTMASRCIPGLDGFAHWGGRVDHDYTAAPFVSRALLCLWMRLLEVGDK